MQSATRQMFFIFIPPESRVGTIHHAWRQTELHAENKSDRSRATGLCIIHPRRRFITPKMTPQRASCTIASLSGRNITSPSGVAVCSSEGRQLPRRAFTPDAIAQDAWRQEITLTRPPHFSPSFVRGFEERAEHFQHSARSDPSPPLLIRRGELTAEVLELKRGLIWQELPGFPVICISLQRGVVGQ